MYIDRDAEEAAPMQQQQQHHSSGYHVSDKKRDFERKYDERKSQKLVERLVCKGQKQRNKQSSRNERASSHAEQAAAAVNRLSTSTARKSSSAIKMKKVKWTCKACTYQNITEFAITDSSPKMRALCEMCSTPQLIRVRSSKSDFPKPSSSKNQGETTQVERPNMASRTTSTGENTLATSTASSNGSRSSRGSGGRSGKTSYTMAELIECLGQDENSGVNLPPSLAKRVEDFRFAQNKRRQKHGDQKPWGIYGLYAHLSDIRADLEWAEEAAWRRHKGKPYLSWKDFDESRDKGLHSRPIFTYSVMALCTIMLFVTIGVNGGFEPLNINPLIGPSSDTLIKCGARDTDLIVNQGQWFRLFTPMILHAGLVHYFINMLALYFIGGAVEKAHGAASAAVLFTVPAVGGNILSAICLPGFISVGASGGIFGLIGGCMADICLNWNLLFLKTTADDDTRWRHFYVLVWLATDIIVNCLLGFTPFVDNFTHLGGFIYGFLIGFASIERLAETFFGVRPVGETKWSRLARTCLRFFGLIVSVIAIMATTIVLAQSDGVTSPCPGCRYVSCVPFPPRSEDKWWYCDDCDMITADIYQSIDGSGLYSSVNINCPNGEIEEIPIDDMQIYEKEELQRLLPKFCRNYCEEVYANPQ